MQGCIELTGVVKQLLKDAKYSKEDFVILWLDLSNAYGSIPHKLVKGSLKKKYLPEKIKDLIIGYYDKFKIRIWTENSRSNWYMLERGIITGCMLLTNYPFHVGHEYGNKIC